MYYFIPLAWKYELYWPLVNLIPILSVYVHLRTVVQPTLWYLDRLRIDTDARIISFYWASSVSFELSSSYMQPQVGHAKTWSLSNFKLGYIHIIRKKTDTVWQSHHSHGTEQYSGISVSFSHRFIPFPKTHSVSSKCPCLLNKHRIDDGTHTSN